MESKSGQGISENEKGRIYREFPFLKYIKGRLVSYINPETKKVYTGHVAMFYRDTKKLRIDWDNGATTYHDFGDDSKWMFHIAHKKSENMD